MHIDNKSGESEWSRHVLMPVHAVGRSHVPNPEVPWEMMVEVGNFLLVR